VLLDLDYDLTDLALSSSLLDLDDASSVVLAYQPPTCVLLQYDGSTFAYSVPRSIDCDIDHRLRELIVHEPPPPEEGPYGYLHALDAAVAVGLVSHVYGTLEVVLNE
jgi:hypothetical protein